jgi:hypothetical protein
MYKDYYLSIGDEYRTAISLIRLTNEHDRPHNTAKKEDHSPQTGKMLFLNIFRTGTRMKRWYELHVELCIYFITEM